LPEGAVRQKMMVEGFSEAEIESFFTNGPPTTAAPAAAVADELFAKYVKMQKMLPEGAVRQKMMVDGFTEAEIEGFFTNGPPTTTATPVPAAAPAVVDERFAKYVKMQKMLPEGAVRQKMMVDGFTEAEIEGFFSVGSASAAASTPAAGPKPPSLTPAEAIKFAKYEKMLKMLPEGAVRQKMTSEEVAPEDIEKFFAVMNGAKSASSSAAGAVPGKPAAPKAPVIEPPPEGMLPKPKITPGAKLKGIFWTKLKNSSIKGTVWHKLPEYTLPPDEVKALETLFGTKVSAADSATPEEKAAAAEAIAKKAGKKLTSVLDAQRTQNVMIIMGKVRLSAEQILQLIIDLDPEVLHQELAHMLFEVLPTAEGTVANLIFEHIASDIIFWRCCLHVLRGALFRVLYTLMFPPLFCVRLIHFLS
jgi:hypothetical protein